MRVWCDVSNFRIRDDIRLMRYVEEWLPPRYFWTSVENTRDRAIFNKWRFFFSATPFCCGVLTHEFTWTISYLDKYSPRIESKYSLTLFDFGIWILILNSIWTMELNALNILLASNFSFVRKIQVSLVWSFTNVKNHRAPLIFFIWECP